MAKTLILDRKASEKNHDDIDRKKLELSKKIPIDELEKASNEIGTKVPVKIDLPIESELSDDDKTQLKLDKKLLSQKMKEINDKLGIKPSTGWKYHLPNKPRTGTWSKVLSMRDSRVAMENLFYQLSPELFETYLSIQKNDMDLDTWLAKFELDKDSMEIAKRFVTVECIQNYKDMPDAKSHGFKSKK